MHLEALIFKYECGDEMLEVLVDHSNKKWSRTEGAMADTLARNDLAICL